MVEAAKIAILFAAPGTTCREAEIAFENITSHAEKRFPFARIFWTYTSKIVRQRLADRGRHVDSPSEALELIRKAGFTHLFVHPLHTVAGSEYRDLTGSVATFNNTCAGIVDATVGDPLLSSREKFTETIEVLLHRVCPEQAEDEALVLMAHGTEDVTQASAIENAAGWCEGTKGNVLLGALMQPPSIGDVINTCKSLGIRRVYLAPFMTVAGFSARSQLGNGDGVVSDSWNYRLSEAGIECHPAIRGLGEYDDIVEAWVDRMQPTIETWSTP